MPASVVLIPSKARWVSAFSLSVVHSMEASHMAKDIGVPVQKCRFKKKEVIEHFRKYILTKSLNLVYFIL